MVIYKLRMEMGMHRTIYLTLVVDRRRSRVHGGPQQLGGDVRRALSERDCAVQTVAVVHEQLCEGEVGHLEVDQSMTSTFFSID